MAHFVEEGMEDASVTGSTNAAKKVQNINEWLKANRLTRLKDYFELNEIEMEDLMMFSETDLQLSIHPSFFCP